MTDTIGSKELVERLRAATPTASSILRASTGEDPFALDNDISTACHKAADRIETLEAENERLRAAVARVNRYLDRSSSIIDPGVVRAALEGKDE